MVYDKQTLYKWHVNRFVTPNEKTSDEDKKPVGDFHFSMANGFLSIVAWIAYTIKIWTKRLKSDNMWN